MKPALMITAILSAVFAGCHVNARSSYKEKITFYDDLNYGASQNKNHGFDLYLPKATTGPTPAAIFIHGGYWRNQSRRYYRAFTGLYENFGLALASRGIATAVIDYRLFPEANLDAQLSDVAAAVAHLKAHAREYNIDPTAIFVTGHSAGGHLALMDAWQRHDGNVRGVVALSPILDIAHMRKNKEADFNRELTVPFFGTGAKDAEHSPATYVNKDSVPALVLFGENDYAYLIEQGTKYRDNFNAAKLKQIRIETVADTDHSAMVMDVATSKDKISDKMAQYIQTVSAKR